MLTSPVTPLPRTPTAPPLLALIVEGLCPGDLSRAHSPFLERLRGEAAVDCPLQGAPGEQCWGEVFAGAWPEATGALALWTLDPTESLHLGRASAWARCAADALAHPVQRFLAGRVARRPSSRKTFPPPPLAPLGIRGRLRAVDDPGVYLRPGRAPIPTLMDSLVAGGCRVELTAFPATPWEESQLVARLGYMSRAFLDRHDLYLARLPGGRRLLLDHGPGAPERNQLVRELDGLIERLVGRFRRQWPDGPILIAAVRGSVAARTYFDAGKHLQAVASRFGLLPYRDYALLLNRTLARFWALSPVARSVLPLLAEEAHALRRYGVTLTPELAARHRLPPPGILAGDWIWFAHPGVVVFPNHHDVERPRSAAGYLEGDASTGEPDGGGKPDGDIRPAHAPDAPPGKKTPKPSDARTGAGRAAPLARKTDSRESDTDGDRGLLMICAPEKPPIPRYRGEAARSAWRVDLCVTLAAMLGVRIPAAARGRDLLAPRDSPPEPGRNTRTQDGGG